MEQYIPKSVLVSELKRRLHFDNNWIEDDKRRQTHTNGVSSVYYRMLGSKNACESFLDFIDTLEVKEVDYTPMDNDFERDAVNFCFDNSLNTTPRIAKTIAKHFFELGIKAQNNTTNLKQRISVLKMEFWTGLQTFENSEMTLSDAYNQGINDILEELDIKL